MFTTLANQRDSREDGNYIKRKLRSKRGKYRGEILSDKSGTSIH